MHQSINNKNQQLHWNQKVFVNISVNEERNSDKLYRNKATTAIDSTHDDRPKTGSNKVWKQSTNFKLFEEISQTPTQFKEIGYFQLAIRLS